MTAAASPKEEESEEWEEQGNEDEVEGTVRLGRGRDPITDAEEGVLL